MSFTADLGGITYEKINSIRISFRFNIHNDRNCKCKCRGAEVKLVLWSSVFVTLMAKKYRFMQFELDMVFDTH